MHKFHCVATLGTDSAFELSSKVDSIRFDLTAACCLWQSAMCRTLGQNPIKLANTQTSRRQRPQYTTWRMRALNQNAILTLDKPHTCSTHQQRYTSHTHMHTSQIYLSNVTVGAANVPQAVASSVLTPRGHCLRRLFRCYELVNINSKC